MEKKKLPIGGGFLHTFLFLPRKIVEMEFNLTTYFSDGWQKTKTNYRTWVVVWFLYHLQRVPVDDFTFVGWFPLPPAGDGSWSSNIHSTLSWWGLQWGLEFAHFRFFVALTQNFGLQCLRMRPAVYNGVSCNFRFSQVSRASQRVVCVATASRDAQTFGKVGNVSQHPVRTGAAFGQCNTAPENRKKLNETHCVLDVLNLFFWGLLEFQITCNKWLLLQASDLRFRSKQLPSSGRAGLPKWSTWCCCSTFLKIHGLCGAVSKDSGCIYI